MDSKLYEDNKKSLAAFDAVGIKAIEYKLCVN